MTKSKFIKVKTQCGNEQVIFSNATEEIRCLVTNEVIAKSTGGKIKIIEGKATIIEEYK